MSSKSISRRRLLRGVGASIALPFLNIMARGNTAETDEAPRRSVFVYVPNGVNTLTWQIQQEGAEYRLSESLQPLSRHRESITPISGLHHPNGIGRDHKCEQIWLTGAPAGPRNQPFRNTVSVDQVMAEAIGEQTRFSSLELSITGGTLAWSRGGTPLPAEQRPGVVFQKLFGTLPGGQAQAVQMLDRRKSVLDRILEDARTLRRDIGHDDRLKLDEYLESVRSVEIQTERAEAWLQTPKPEIDEATTTHLMHTVRDAEAGDYYRTMYDLMVLALQTDMTRVITCMSGREGRGLALPEIGIDQNRHELSHHNGDPQLMQRLTRCDQFLTEQFAYFLDQLASRTEQGRSLLDRSMVLFGSGMSYGNIHGNANLPIVIAGGAACGLKHAQHLDFNLPVIGEYDIDDPQSYYPICMRPTDDDARLSNVLLTMLHRMNIPTDHFADSTGIIRDLLK